MNAIMPKDQFWAKMAEARQSIHSGMHPFSRAWADGKLSREQLGDWVVQHHYYISPVAPHQALLVSRLPDLDARRHMLENLFGEEPMGTPEKRHPELLIKFGLACGKSREAIEKAEELGTVLPTTRAMAAWTWELTAVRHVVEACAGLMVALEGQIPTLYPKYVTALQKMGFSDDDLEFFYVHIGADTEHARIGLELTARYAETPKLQQKAINIVRATAEMRYSMLNGIYDAIVLKQEPLRKRA